MSDRIAVMSNGVIEQLDEPRAIYDRPLTPFVADFIGDMNFLDGEVVEAGDGGFALDAGAGVVVRGRGAGRRAGGAVRVGIRPERMAAASGRARRHRQHGRRPRSSRRCTSATRSRSSPRSPAGPSVVVREQRASADPALDTIHPGDRIAISWDEAAPLLLGDATAPASERRRHERRSQRPAEHPRPAIDASRSSTTCTARSSDAAGMRVNRREALGLGGLALLAAACGGTHDRRRRRRRRRRPAGRRAGGQAARGPPGDLQLVASTTTPRRTRSSSSCPPRPRRG